MDNCIFFDIQLLVSKTRYTGNTKSPSKDQDCVLIHDDVAALPQGQNFHVLSLISSQFFE